MAENKTKPTGDDVFKFIDSIQDETRRKDSLEITGILTEITGYQPKLWGSAIIGFGSYHYKYESGREGDSILSGFSPRKQNLTIYLMLEYAKSENPEVNNILEKLGKYKLGKGCLYINRLQDINIEKLKELIGISVELLKKRYGQK